MRRGQLSVFVIVAILVVIITGIIIYGNLQLSNQAQQELGTQYELSGMRVYVADCLGMATEEALLKAGRSGGFLSETVPGIHLLLIDSANSDSLEPLWIPYYFEIGKIYTPELPQLEQGLELQLSQKVQECLASHHLAGQFNAVDSQTTITILPDLLKVSVEGIDVIESRAVTRLNPVVLELPVRLGRLLASAEQIATAQQPDVELLCASCLLDVAETNGIEINMVPFPNEDAVILSLTDPQSVINNKPYRLLVAMKFLGGEQ